MEAIIDSRSDYWVRHRISVLSHKDKWQAAPWPLQPSGVFCNSQKRFIDGKAGNSLLRALCTQVQTLSIHTEHMHTLTLHTHTIHITQTHTHTTHMPTSNHIYSSPTSYTDTQHIYTYILTPYIYIHMHTHTTPYTLIYSHHTHIHSHTHTTHIYIHTYTHKQTHQQSAKKTW